MAARTPDLAIDLPLILLLASGYGFTAPGPASQDHHLRRIQVLDGTGRRQLRGLARPDVEAEGSEDWGRKVRLLKGLREQGKGEEPLIHAAAGANLIIRQVIALLIKAAGDHYSQSQLLVNRQLLEGLERQDA
jgi:hypothetical protein